MPDLSTRVVLIVFFVAVLGGDAPARPRASPAAVRHYNRGMTLVELRRYDEAIHEWEKGFAAQANPNFLFNIALAHRKLAARAAMSIQPEVALNREMKDENRNLNEEIATLTKYQGSAVGTFVGGACFILGALAIALLPEDWRIRLPMLIVPSANGVAIGGWF